MLQNLFWRPRQPALPEVIAVGVALSACEELQRDNESLSTALDRMTDKSASLAGIKP
jgi:hypothetical protein